VNAFVTILAIATILALMVLALAVRIVASAASGRAECSTAGCNCAELSARRFRMWTRCAHRTVPSPILWRPGLMEVNRGIPTGPVSMTAQQHPLFAGMEHGSHGQAAGLPEPFFGPAVVVSGQLADELGKPGVVPNPYLYLYLSAHDANGMAAAVYPPCTPPMTSGDHPRAAASVAAEPGRTARMTSGADAGRCSYHSKSGFASRYAKATLTTAMLTNDQTPRPASGRIGPHSRVLKRDSGHRRPFRRIGRPVRRRRTGLHRPQPAWRR
jgi:hypothetical protein